MRASPPNFSCRLRPARRRPRPQRSRQRLDGRRVHLSTSASADSPLEISTERSGFIRVGIGFIAARRTISSPFERPPRAAARLVSRSSAFVLKISSWPGSRQTRKRETSPVSTPLTAWIRQRLRQPPVRRSALSGRSEPGGPLRSYLDMPPRCLARPAPCRWPRASLPRPLRRRSRARCRRPRSRSPAATAWLPSRPRRRRRVPGAGALEYVANVIEIVLEQPGEIGVPGRGRVTALVPFPSGSPPAAKAMPQAQCLYAGCRRQARAASRVSFPGANRPRLPARPARSAVWESGRSPAGGDEDQPGSA